MANPFPLEMYQEITKYLGAHKFLQYCLANPKDRSRCYTDPRVVKVFNKIIGPNDEQKIKNVLELYRNFLMHIENELDNKSLISFNFDNYGFSFGYHLKLTNPENPVNMFIHYTTTEFPDECKILKGSKILEELEFLFFEYFPQKENIISSRNNKLLLPFYDISQKYKIINPYFF